MIKKWELFNGLYHMYNVLYSRKFRGVKFSQMAHFLKLMDP